MNSDASWLLPFEAATRVLDHQRKLHHWGRIESARRFDDVFNLVCDRATLLVAWERVANNRGAKTAGVDAMTRYAIQDDDVVPFLEEIRNSLRRGTFEPLPVRQVMIPKKMLDLDEGSPRTKLRVSSEVLRVRNRGRGQAGPL